jgi:drug/metabolite transporter (DMT)-like permease
MRTAQPLPHNETAGLLYGLLGITIFGFTLPATRIAVADLSPTFVGLGRALVAAALAALLLAATRQAWPTRRQARQLGLVAAGVVVGFPLLSAWALRVVPANHGAIMLGILPLATAIAGSLRAGERPSWQFWLVALSGSLVVLWFALFSGGGLQLADLALIGAVAAAAFGYAEGARLARELGSWQVICWALVLAAPFLALPVAWVVASEGLRASPAAWLGFSYVSVFSMFIGFFAWYRGLALGGIARVGQVQLLQPFVTLAASVALLGETITPVTLGVALVVAAIVAIGRKTAIRRGPL